MNQNRGLFSGFVTISLILMVGSMILAGVSGSVTEKKQMKNENLCAADTKTCRKGHLFIVFASAGLRLSAPAHLLSLARVVIKVQRTSVDFQRAMISSSLILGSSPIRAKSALHVACQAVSRASA